jgi:hypothetical protein
MTGLCYAVQVNKLVSETPVFTTNLLGAIVVKTTTNAIANVIGFESATKLLLDADIFTTDGDGYAIYNSDNNQGCAIYIPTQTPGKITVLTVGGDVVTFKGCGDLNASIILPVNVLKVFSTDLDLTDLTALW